MQRARRTLDAIVGRERELRALGAALDGGARLVTLVGPPGIGKTRLAQALLEARAGAETIAWVELGPVTERGDLCARVASALGVRLSWLDPGEFAEELGYAIDGYGPVWLALDEAEGCVDALATLLPRWLVEAEGARAIVTSRERLGLAGEHVVEVGPLAIGEAPLDSAAGELLLSRAGVARAEIAKGTAASGTARDRTSSPLPRDREASYAALTRALEGIPLAIELAAARLALLTPDELLERLREELDLLEARPPRGRATLRDALARSWQLLSADERRALAYCATFRGPFTAAAAEALIGAPSLAALAGLRDKSMIARDESERLRLYGTVRAFARERALAEGPSDVDARHARWALGESTRALESGDPGAALGPALADLRAAVPHTDGADRATLALGIAAALALRGPHGDALPLLDAALADARADARRAALHLARGRALEVTGRVDEAIEAYHAALASEVDGTEVTEAEIAEAWTATASAELARGRLDAAHDAIERVFVAGPAAGRGLARVDALRTRGVIAHARGRLDEADDAYAAARAMARELGAHARAARLGVDLGAVRLAERRLDEARELYEAALEELDPESDAIPLGLAEGNLAILEQELGHHERAETHYAAGIARLRRVGHRLFVAHLMAYAGALQHERLRVDDASARYDVALEALRRIGDARLVAVVAALRAAAESARGRSASAEASLREAEEALGRVDDAGVAACVAICGAHLELARGDRRAAQARLDDVDPALLESSDDARLAARLLRAALGHGALHVDAAACALTLPDGTRVDLATRSTLWRLVVALLDARRARPGEALDVEALRRAGWPEESMAAESAINRVKVALSTLRKLGLRAVLRRSEGGYLLDPAVPLADPQVEAER